MGVYWGKGMGKHRMVSEKASTVKIRVYLDNCCFNRPFDEPLTPNVPLEAAAKTYVQRQIRAGKIELAWSYVLDHENADNPHSARKSAIASWKHLAIVDISEDEEVIRMAHAVAKRGIRNMDALHIACAIKAKCDYFLTTDKRILRKWVGGISLLNPLDYVPKVEGRA